MLHLYLPGAVSSKGLHHAADTQAPGIPWANDVQPEWLLSWVLKTGSVVTEVPKAWEVVKGVLKVGVSVNTV